jgi:hypothetical protein
MPDVDASSLDPPMKPKHKQSWAVVFERWLALLEAREVAELKREIKRALRGEIE